MTGRKEPTKEEQRALIHKRMFLLENGPGSRNGKRFNRQGVSNFDTVNVAASKGGDGDIAAQVAAALKDGSVAQGAGASSTGAGTSTAGASAAAAGNGTASYVYLGIPYEIMY